MVETLIPIDHEKTDKVIHETADFLIPKLVDQKFNKSEARSVFISIFFNGMLDSQIEPWEFQQIIDNMAGQYGKAYKDGRESINMTMDIRQHS